MTKKRIFAILIALLTFAVGVAVARFSLPQLRRAPAAPATKELQLSNYRLSGPYQHENLTIFLVHAPDQDGSRMFMPLGEAMERKLVIVHETSDVNELAIENVSESEEVFVQAGDIVKGGQQDRVLGVDLILPANSGRIPIAAFCVESARWSQRGRESLSNFSASQGMIATKQLKLATKHDASQRQVWNEVEVANDKLTAGVAANVRARESESSFQLALENDKVQEFATRYLDELTSIVDTYSDVIGFVFAINNSLNSADVYSTNAQFKRFWPRLLKTAAIEAIAERTSDVPSEIVSISGTGEFLIGSERGTETLNEVTTRTHMLKREADASLFFETRDMAHGGAWVHRNYLTR